MSNKFACSCFTGFNNGIQVLGNRGRRIRLTKSRGIRTFKVNQRYNDRFGSVFDNYPKGRTMLTSMTGFSRYERKAKGFTVLVEMKSLNNRYLDIIVKLPRRYGAIEEAVRDTVRTGISRGKVDVFISIDGLSDTVDDITINLPLAKKYIDGFKTLEKTFSIPVSLGPESLLTIDNIFELKVSETQIQFLHDLILKTVRGALKGLQKHRREEGKNLLKDFYIRLTSISGSLRSIQKIFGSRFKDDHENLRKRIVATLENIEKIDPRRLEAEAALMAEKFDISEECVRLDSHLKMFKSSLSENDAVGRRLDFILQEINREANTMGAKSNNVAISQEVVRIKEEIERLKEQVRNIE